MSNQKIFDYIKDFKKLPSYQFERRIDAFILPYLVGHFNKQFKSRFKGTEEDFVFLYPEFPVQRCSRETSKGDIQQEKYSDYVDFIMWSKHLNTIFLVEFKTEANSLNYDQFKCYVEACKRGWHSLISYYFYKAIRNNSWRKFTYGIKHINNLAPELLGLTQPLALDEFILKERGMGVNKYLENLKDEIKSEPRPTVKFMYLAPQKCDEQLKSFVLKNVNDSLYYEGLITLSNFAESVDDELKELFREIA